MNMQSMYEAARSLDSSSTKPAKFTINMSWVY